MAPTESLQIKGYGQLCSSGIKPNSRMLSLRLKSGGFSAYLLDLILGEGGRDKSNY